VNVHDSDVEQRYLSYHNIFSSEDEQRPAGPHTEEEKNA
jgi:hypothetical protein